MIIYILGQSPVGSTKRLLATDTCMYFQQAARKVFLQLLLQCWAVSVTSEYTIVCRLEGERIDCNIDGGEL